MKKFIYSCSGCEEANEKLEGIYKLIEELDITWIDDERRDIIIREIKELSS